EAPHQILYNCVDTREFVPLANKKPTEPWILLAAGTHQQYERVRSVLETVSQLRARGRDVRLILAGKLDFPLAETNYNDLVRELNAYEWIERLPPFSQEAARDLYRRAHLLLHPKYKDPCPTVVIEGMSSGVPVVGSNSGGMEELIGSDAGVLIEVPESWYEMHVPGTIEMADAVELLMRDWLPRSRAARRRAELLFNKEDWLDRHAEIFESLLRPE
ncbi:MAG: glycosyltransferase family 4 protein, partial [Gammaproteobacteria bacterium]|nr:glycosyltransferase family 4 protein [Gammaproteobacteria bacterium]